MHPTIFGLMLVCEDHADGFVGGRTRVYADTIRPAIQLVGLRDGVSRVSALELLALKDRLVFCADTMVNIDPSAEELAEIAILAAEAAHMFGIEPRVALLSFSSFGSVQHSLAARVARAVQLVREQRPDLVVDGEMHVDPAVVEERSPARTTRTRGSKAMPTSSSSPTSRLATSATDSSSGSVVPRPSDPSSSASAVRWRCCSRARPCPTS